MRKPRVTRSVRAAGLAAVLLTSPAVLSLQGCTDLSENPFSVITPDNFYRTEEEVIAGLASAYSSLRGSLWGYYNLSEISSDEMIVPTRGGDWYDNRRWLEIHYQDWTANSPSALDDMNGTWNDMFTGVARSNVLLSVLPGIQIAERDAVVAEVRALRAFYYYVLMDLFGGVPIVTDTEIMVRPKNTRAEVFQFIESELLEARGALPPSWPANMHGRMTRGAANAILANMYLNAGVFARDQGVSANSYNTCQGVQVQYPGAQDACAAAIAAADAVLSSGAGYQLSADYHANFRHDNHTSRENIFVVKNLNESGLGFEMLYRPIHYNSGIGGGWNGFSTLAETYYNYDTLAIEVVRLQRLSIHAGPFTDELRLLRSGDPRHDIFHDGVHFNLETGDTVFYRNSSIPLTFSPHYPFGETQAGEGDGVRLLKWPRDPNFVGSNHANDFAYFRLAEIYLIKAEAHAVLADAGQALANLNIVRQRAMPTKPLAGLAGEALLRAVLRERHMEFAGEAKRRQDLIRAGRFTAPWSFKCSQRPDGSMAPGRCNDARNLLFPIPQTQIDANPLLEQNPGY
jgi:starch-binding outer membrane protein, SusD/RagB family